MEIVGIALNAIGAILIAYSQVEMNRTISMWLRTLDGTVDQMRTPSSNIVRVRGIDMHWDRDLKRDRVLSPIGWILFVRGLFLILVGRGGFG